MIDIAILLHSRKI